jgi:hypothetical protein
MTEVLKKGEPLSKITVSESRTPAVAVGVRKPFLYPLAAGESEKLTKVCEIPAPVVRAPVAAGCEAGEIKVYLQNELLFTEKLYTIESADSLPLWDRLKDIASKWNI